MVKLAWSFADSAYRDNLITSPIPKEAVLMGLYTLGNDVLIVHEYEDITIISVPGSDDFLDWKRNITELEQGFQDAAEKFKPHIKRHILTGKDILLTGHSMGGAIVTYLAEHIEVCYNRSVGVITFGCPRPGRKAFRDYYNRLRIDHTNVYIKGDIVATSVLHYSMGYRHVGKEIILKPYWLWILKRLIGCGHRRHEITKQVNEKFKSEGTNNGEF